jgi:adenylate cyclase
MPYDTTIIAHTDAAQLTACVCVFGWCRRLQMAPGEAIADQVPRAAVLFVSLPNYGELVQTAGRDEASGVLNRLLCAFDDVLRRFPQVEKIKSHGSTYMAAAGLAPAASAANAMGPVAKAEAAAAASGGSSSGTASGDESGMEDDTLEEGAGGVHPALPLARFALALAQVLAAHTPPTEPPLSFRAGLAVGPCIAGVLGQSKFCYDIWGDTVNVASRMESTGVVGRVQVTAAARRVLRPAFRLEPRGDVAVKGKGSMRTWLLGTPRRPAAAVAVATAAAGETMSSTTVADGAASPPFLLARLEGLRQLGVPQEDADEAVARWDRTASAATV